MKPEDEKTGKAKVWPTEAKAYVKKGLIGKGATAEVWRGNCPAMDSDCALKIIKSTYLESSTEAWKMLTKEIKILKQLAHPNIVQLYTSFASGEDLWMVMELVDAGSCRDILNHSFPEGFPEPVVASIGRQVLEALNYLHSTEKMHRDIKAGNIFVDKSGCVKLGDFGFVGTFVENGFAVDVRNTLVGTSCWTAPEVYKNTVSKSGYDYSADIWSFGITLIELAKGKAPYQSSEPGRIIQLIVDSLPPTLDSEDDKKKFSKVFRKLISQCLVRDPASRLPTAKLLKHPFFKKVTEPQKIVLEGALSKLPAKWNTRTISADGVKEEDKAATSKLKAMLAASSTSSSQLKIKKASEDGK